MDHQAAKDALSVLLASFHQELAEDELVLWLDTLQQIDDVDVALVVARELRFKQDWFPTHHQFVEAIKADQLRRARQHEERMLNNAPTHCGRCDGALIVDVAVVGNAVGITAVEFCPQCTPSRKPLDEHAKSCSCMDCHYGPRGAARIRSGRDGIGPRPDHIADPLQRLSSVAEQERF